MSEAKRPPGNILGDLKAETDRHMLERAFLETPDYRSLIETADWTLVVGRRGTGKSALFYRLSKHWSGSKSAVVIHLAPEEEDVIGMRALVRLFGEVFTHLRAATKIAWRYGLMMEILLRLQKQHRVAAVIHQSRFLQTHLTSWSPPESSFFFKLRAALRRAVAIGKSVEERIGELAQVLQINELQNHLEEILEEVKVDIFVLIDKLDEGYEPDTVGIGFVDGVIYGTTDLKARLPRIRPVIFLRDNIFRAVAQSDPDYSRNVEGQVLRLHWDPYHLFVLVCNRLRSAFHVEVEQDQKVWDRLTARELQGPDGFRRCLQLTLYRPRDLLVLFNQAYSVAFRNEREQILLSDLEVTAKHISENRFDDLQKEYRAIFPAISAATARFASVDPEITVRKASALLERLSEAPKLAPEVQQDLAILANPIQVLKTLYSVGFIGLRDQTSNTWVFCHDGRNPDTEFSDDNRLLIHPCYWMALSLTKCTLKPEDAEEIFDEYEIRVSSLTPQLRAQKLGALIAELGKIPTGKDGDTKFEQWCLDAIRIAFAGQLDNIELRPNRNATQRRDIVATNLSKSAAWRRIREDYETRQVIFEVKNFEGMGRDEYRQMLSYLTDCYGKLGFIVCRDSDYELRKGRELEWFREMWNSHRIMVVKLSGRFFTNILSKLRNPQKHDAVDRQLNSILDNYSRLYLSGQTVPATKRRHR